MLALWRLHNKVNARLTANGSAEASTDHAHPKVQFPSLEQCSDCKISGVWDEGRLLRFLSDFYMTDA